MSTSEFMPGFSSPAARYFPFSYEIAQLIVDLLDLDPVNSVDYAILDSLSKSAPVLRNVCQSILFKSVNFDFRRCNIQTRMEQFTSLLCDNPLLATFVRDFRIADDTPTPASPLYHTGFSLYPTTKVEAVEFEKINLQFASTVKKMSGLRAFRLVFVCGKLEWTQLSLGFQTLLRNVTQQPYLSTLRLQGLDGIPWMLLAQFPSLKFLTLWDISVDMHANITADPNDMQKIIYNFPISSHNRLHSLNIRNVPANGALYLMDLWRQHAEQRRPGVDLSRPQEINVAFGKSAECLVPMKAIHLASPQLKALTLHAGDLGQDLVGIPDTTRQHPALEAPSFSGWFRSQPLVQPHDLTCLTALTVLQIHVQYWPVDAEIEQLKWALSLLESMPGTCLQNIFIVVNVGDMDILYDNLERIFGPWWSELQKDKWVGLEKFMLTLRSWHGEVNEEDDEQMEEEYDERMDEDEDEDEEIDEQDADDSKASEHMDEISTSLEDIADNFGRQTFARRKTEFWIQHHLRFTEGAEFHMKRQFF